MSSRSPSDVPGIEVVESSGKKQKVDSSGSPSARLEGDCASLDEDDEVDDVKDGIESSELEEAERVKIATRSVGDVKVLPRVRESVSTVLETPSVSVTDSLGRFVGTRLGSLGFFARFFSDADLKLDGVS